MLGLAGAPDLLGGSKKATTSLSGAPDLNSSGGFDFDDDFEKMLEGRQRCGLLLFLCPS